MSCSPADSIPQASSTGRSPTRSPPPSSANPLFSLSACAPSAPSSYETLFCAIFCWLTLFLTLFFSLFPQAYTIDGTLAPQFSSFTKAAVGDYGLVDLFFVPSSDNSSATGTLIASFSLSSTAVFYSVAISNGAAALTPAGRIDGAIETPSLASTIRFAPLVVGVPGFHAVHRHVATGDLFFASGIEQKVHVVRSGTTVVNASIDTAALGGWPSAVSSLDEVLVVAVTPCNTSLEATCAEQGVARGKLVFVHLPTLTVFRILTVGAGPTSVDFTADRRFLVVCNSGRAYYDVANATNSIDPPVRRKFGSFWVVFVVEWLHLW